MEQVRIDSARGGLRWGSIWGGLFVIAGVQILMELFGLAIGISALSPTRGAIEGVSIWAGIWAIISTCVAFFCGGWFATSSVDLPAGPREWLRLGVAVWGFALTIGIFFATSGLVGAIDIARNLLVPPGVHGGVHGYTIGAAWATFGTVLVALGCALGGAALGAGVSAARRHVTDTRTVVTGPRAPTPVA